MGSASSKLLWITLTMGFTLLKSAKIEASAHHHERRDLALSRIRDTVKTVRCLAQEIEHVGRRAAIQRRADRLEFAAHSLKP